MSGVAAFVVCELFSVYIDICDHGSAQKFQIDLISCGILWSCQILYIPTGASVIVVTTILAVLGVPGVGQADKFSGGGGSGRGICC